MSFEDIKQRILVKMDEWDRDLGLHEIPLMTAAHEKTGQKRIHLIAAASVLVLCLIIGIFGLSFISNIVAFYPVYNSFKALRTPSPHDDQYWLTYWVVYGSLSLMESLIDKVFFWLPFYYVIKTGFLIWCFSPTTKGALVVYDRILGPLFVGIQRDIDDIGENEGKPKRNSVQQHSK